MSEIAAAVAAIFSSRSINALLLVADALIYFAVLAALFRARHRIGIGAFFCALGVMHFLETYLASIVYVVLPFGIVASPGSTVLFTGKLMLLFALHRGPLKGKPVVPATERQQFVEPHAGSGSCTHRRRRRHALGRHRGPRRDLWAQPRYVK